MRNTIGPDGLTDEERTHRIGLIRGGLRQAPPGVGEVIDILDRIAAERRAHAETRARAEKTEVERDVAYKKLDSLGQTFRRYEERQAMLEADLAESERVRDRQRALLDGVAVALRGPPAPDAMHDHARLPEEVSELVRKNALAQAAFQALIDRRKQDRERMRAGGVAFEAVREAMRDYENEELTFGRLVELLRVAVDNATEDMRAHLSEAEAEAEAQRVALARALRMVALRVCADDTPCFCVIKITDGEPHHLSCQNARAIIAAYKESE